MRENKIQKGNDGVSAKAIEILYIRGSLTPCTKTMQSDKAMCIAHIAKMHFAIYFPFFFVEPLVVLSLSCKF